jgi:hypothetical protein
LVGVLFSISFAAGSPTMKTIKSIVFLCLILFLTTVAMYSQPTPGKLFTVDFNGDSVDADFGDGVCRDSQGRCSLRAAIEQANVDANSPDVIIFNLPNPSVVDLTLGELAITSRVSIVGPGARRLTVQRSFAQGTPEFRIFHLMSGSGGLITGITIANGRVTGSLYGGGVYVEQNSNLSLTSAEVRNNFAHFGGGVANAGFVDVIRSLITGNRGNNNAGAIYNVHNTSPILRIMNSTITGNSANAHGAISNEGRLVLVNSTVTHNSADEVTSGIASYPAGTVHVLNTIIGSDTSPILTSLAGTFVSFGNNIITDARNSSGFTNGVNNDQVSDANAIDPQLGPVTNNGGGTDTRALLAGSPAINTGSNCVISATCPVLPHLPQFFLSSDQRSGFPRRTGDTVDVGAFEHNSTMPSVSFTFGVGFFNRPARHAGSIAVLTNATTNEKRYAAVNPFGSVGFQSIPVDVYVLEIRSKRAGMSMVLVIDLNDLIGIGFMPQDQREISIKLKQE